MNVIVHLLVSVLIIAVLTGCGGTTDEIERADDVAYTELTPQRADMIGLIKLSQILSDKDLEDLYDILPKDPGDAKTLDEVINTVVEEQGINLRDFNSVFFFIDTSSGIDESGYSGLIVNGTYDESDIIRSVEETNEVHLNSYEHNGKEVYADIEEMTAIAFLDNRTLVIGTVDSVRDVLDVMIGDGTPLSGDVRDKYSSLGDVLMKAEASISTELIEDLISQASDYLEVPIDLSALVNIETAEMIMDKVDESLITSYKICCTNSESAAAVAELILNTKDIIPLIDFSETDTDEIPLPEISEELLPELLAMSEVEAVEDCVTIISDMTFDEIEELFSE